MVPRMTISSSMFVFWVLYSLSSLTLCQKSPKTTRAPFLEAGTVHAASSDLEVNLILNENRNRPILILEYSQNKIHKLLEPKLKEGLQLEPHVALALTVNCSSYQKVMSQNISICKPPTQPAGDQFLDSEDISSDPSLKLMLFAPNKQRLVYRGHLMMKAHQPVDLLRIGSSISGAFLKDTIKQSIPDLINYIQDGRDLKDFIQSGEDTAVVKKSKLIYFDQNGQAPLWLRKVAIALDLVIAVGVTDNQQIRRKYKADFDQLILLEWLQGKHQARGINFDADQGYETIMASKRLAPYTSIARYRDILIDFEHTNIQQYYFNSLLQVAILAQYERLILLEISEGSCQWLPKMQQEFKTLFNYVCYASNGEQLPQKGSKLLFKLDGSMLALSDDCQYDQILQHLPKLKSRQIVSSMSDMRLCYSTAVSAGKEAIMYRFNRKTAPKSQPLMQYLISLQPISSLFYFCQVSVADSELKEWAQLDSTSHLISLKHANQQGEIAKFDMRNITQFLEIKMFLRERAIEQMEYAYHKRLTVNQLVQLHTAQQLSQHCFSKLCVIGLIATDKFRRDIELKILVQMQPLLSGSQVGVFWIDGTCHSEVGRQLGLTKAKETLTRSHLFAYKEKGSIYLLWQSREFWDKKEALRWGKPLKTLQGKPKNAQKRVIDLELRECPQLRSFVGQAEQL